VLLMAVLFGEVLVSVSGCEMFGLETCNEELKSDKIIDLNSGAISA
jgi:hypothetical protein